MISVLFSGNIILTRPALCVLGPFMSVSATTSVASPAPDPDRAGPDTLPRVGRLLRIVRRLVAYGTNLVATLQQGSSAHRRDMAMIAFGTTDIARIIARIKCGLLRAAGLETRLNGYVKRGRDMEPPAERLSTACMRKAASDDAMPKGTRSEVLADLPSAEEIAAQVRSRPIGTVIGDILRDFGMAPGAMDGALWDELWAAVLDCGIDLTGFLRKCVRPVFGDYDLQVESALTGWDGKDGAVGVSGQPP